MLVSCLFYDTLKGQAPAYYLSGKVIDKENGEPLPGAEIYIHELVLGTITDMNGRFKFRNLKPARYHLHIKYIGYESQFKFVQLDENIDDVVFELQPSSVELMEVIIESDPFKTGPVEKSLTVQTVSDDFIKKNPGGTLMNSLEKLPGINTINTGVGISKPVIRGLSFNRVIVADQGIKQEGQQWGADHGLEIDQFSPEQVEIVKGPSSLLYGSDGLGGVVVINPPYLASENTVNGEVAGFYKSNNHLLGTSAMAKGNTSGFVYQGRVTVQDYGDYRVPADQFTYNGYLLPINSRRLKNTAGRELNLSGMAGINKNWGFSTVTVSNYHLQAGLFPGATGIPREYQLQNDGDFRDVNLPRQLVDHFKIISLSNILLGGNWLEMSLGFQHNDRNEMGEPHAHGYQPTPDGNLALGLDLYTYSGNLRYNQVLNDNSKLVYGGQFQHQKNTFDGFEFLLPAFSTTNSGLFIQAQQSIGEVLNLNGGLRYDYGHIDIEQHYESDFSTEDPGDSVLRNLDIKKNFYNLSGAAGLSYFPSHSFNVKINIGSSFRIPTPSELSANGVHHGTFRHERGDPGLSQERGWQLDLNFTYHKEVFHVSLSPFANFFNDFIYLRPVSEFSTLPGGGQVFQYTQNDVIYAGSELYIDYHIQKNFHIETSIEYVWNYNLDTDLPLPFTPPLSGVTEVEYRFTENFSVFKNNRFHLGARLAAAQNRVDRNENPTEGYVLLFAGGGSVVQIGDQDIELLFSVQNILNTFYMNHLSRYRWLNLPEQGRNINISLTMPLKIKNN